MTILRFVRDVTALPLVTGLLTHEVFPCFVIELCWRRFWPWPSCRWSAVLIGAVAIGPSMPLGRWLSLRPRRVAPPAPQSLRNRSRFPEATCAVRPAARRFPVPPTESGCFAARPVPYFGSEPAGRSAIPARLWPRSGLRCHLPKESAFPRPMKNGIRLCARHSRKGTIMHRRTLMDRLESHWADVCLWFVHREFFPPERSIRLVTWLSFFVGLPCPCTVRARS